MTEELQWQKLARLVEAASGIWSDMTVETEGIA
jgi:hypothetical protein